MESILFVMIKIFVGLILTSIILIIEYNLFIYFKNIIKNKKGKKK